MADDAVLAHPPAPADAQPASALPSIPWALVGGVLFAAWLWEKHAEKTKGVAGHDEDDEESEDEDEGDEENEDEVSDVEFTDEPIKKGRKRHSTGGLNDVSDVAGPITDTYVQPIKLAAKGRCKEAVDLLDKQSRSNFERNRKPTVVRAALRRSAKIVTEKCKKQVLDLVEARAAWDKEIEEEVERVGIQLPSTGRRFAPSREDVMVPGPRGARSFDPREALPVRRTRGEAGRFKRRAKAGGEQEYRREGEQGWRILDLHTGAVTRRKLPTGRPRGRPKKLQ